VNTFGKLLIGVILLVVPLGMYAYELMNGISNGIVLPVIGKIYLWESLITMIVGFLPGLLLLIGLFIVWLELDEWKIERELKKAEEEEKEEKKEKKSKKSKKKKKKSKKK